MLKKIVKLFFRTNKKKQRDDFYLGN